jgi:hypothetical protein
VREEGRTDYLKEEEGREGVDVSPAKIVRQNPEARQPSQLRLRVRRVDGKQASHASHAYPPTYLSTQGGQPVVKPGTGKACLAMVQQPDRHGRTDRPCTPQLASRTDCKWFSC